MQNPDEFLGETTGFIQTLKTRATAELKMGLERYPVSELSLPIY